MIYLEQRPAADCEMLLFPVKVENWFATQTGPREVSIVDRRTKQVLHRISPPDKWKD